MSSVGLCCSCHASLTAGLRSGMRQVCEEAWQHAQQQASGAISPHEEFVFRPERYRLPPDIAAAAAAGGGVGGATQAGLVCRTAVGTGALARAGPAGGSQGGGSGVPDALVSSQAWAPVAAGVQEPNLAGQKRALFGEAQKGPGGAAMDAASFRVGYAAADGSSKRPCYSHATVPSATAGWPYPHRHVDEPSAADRSSSAAQTPTVVPGPACLPAGQPSANASLPALQPAWVAHQYTPPVRSCQPSLAPVPNGPAPSAGETPFGGSGRTSGGGVQPSVSPFSPFAFYGPMSGGRGLGSGHASAGSSK
jgi:hypothetical protein